jgi:hypothetical protein
MSSPNATLPPAGWYPDPERPGASRWWTGTEWAPPAPDAVVTVRREPTNGLAVAGFVLGLLATLSFTGGPLAYVLALTGLVLAGIGVTRARELGGRRLQLAWWGVGLSIAGVVLAQLWRAFTG